MKIFNIITRVTKRLAAEGTIMEYVVSKHLTDILLMLCMQKAGIASIFKKCRCLMRETHLPHLIGLKYLNDVLCREMLNN